MSTITAETLSQIINEGHAAYRSALAQPTHVDTESWGRYLDRTYARPSETYRVGPGETITIRTLRPREMTAADLGLFDFSAHRAEVHKRMLATNAVYRRLVLGDAPYSFWLGADHG